MVEFFHTKRMRWEVGKVKRESSKVRNRILLFFYYPLWTFRFLNPFFMESWGIRELDNQNIASISRENRWNYITHNSQQKNPPHPTMAIWQACAKINLLRVKNCFIILMKLPWDEDERMRVENATSYAPTQKQLRPAVKRVSGDVSEGRDLRVEKSDPHRSNKLFTLNISHKTGSSNG